MTKPVDEEVDALLNCGQHDIRQANGRSVGCKAAVQGAQDDDPAHDHKPGGKDSKNLLRALLSSIAGSHTPSHVSLQNWCHLQV